jgi:hypothetical protein
MVRVTEEIAEQVLVADTVAAGCRNNRNKTKVEIHRAADTPFYGLISPI